MVICPTWTKNDKAALDEEELNPASLGTAANVAEFLDTPDDGAHYNVFVDMWNWIVKHLLRNHGRTCQ